MILGDTTRLALRNLGQARLRTALTTMGVSIGIASLAGMVSLGVGLEDQFVGRFIRSGIFDAITVLPGRVFDRPGFAARAGIGRRGIGPTPNPTASPGTPPPVPQNLDDDAVNKLSAIDKVVDVYPNLRVPVELKYGAFSDLLLASGVAQSSRDEGTFQTFTAGGFLPNDTDAACMISLDVAKRIDADHPGDLVGKDVSLGYLPPGATPNLSGILMNPGQIPRTEVTFRIVGVIEHEPTPGLVGGAVSGLMIPISRAKVMAESTSRGGYQSLTVKVRRPQDTQDVEASIKAAGFSAFSLSDAVQSAKRAFLILDIVLSLIGSIALAVSSLGIVNTMVMSILERTREIGVMKAIGGSDADIRKIFLVEACTIGFLGGVVGVALGWLVGRVINFGANLYIQNQGGTPTNLFSLPWWLIAGAIGFSIFVSLIAGSYPASRAARLNPIQALRHD